MYTIYTKRPIYRGPLSSLFIEALCEIAPSDQLTKLKIVWESRTLNPSERELGLALWLSTKEATMLQGHEVRSGMSTEY